MSIKYTCLLLAGWPPGLAGYFPRILCARAGVTTRDSFWQAGRGSAGDVLLEFEHACPASAERRGRDRAQAAAENEGQCLGNQACETMYSFAWPMHVKSFNLKATFFIRSKNQAERSSPVQLSQVMLGRLD